MAHLITCSECKKQLQVPDELIGKKVQCPECKHTFTAETDVEQITIGSKPNTSRSVPVPTRKGEAWETKKGKEEDADDDYEVKKRRRRDDDDDDDDDRSSRRGSRRRRASFSRDWAPHRGGMILAFGIIALVSGMGIIFGPMAWLMGNSDLREIQDGRMDPEGEGMTQTGRILGMIATILSIVGIGLVALYFVAVLGCFCCIPIMGVAGNNRGNPNFRPRRF